MTYFGLFGAPGYLAETIVTVPNSMAALNVNPGPWNPWAVDSQVKFTPTHLASFGALLEAVVPQGLVEPRPKAP